MALDTYDPILGLILPVTGNDNNSWGDIFNTSQTTKVAQAVAGAIIRTDTGGTLDLSGSPPPATARQDIHLIQKFTGALVSDLTVIVPNLSKSWAFLNLTSGAFSLFVKTTAMATPIQIPQGTMKLVIGDGANALYRADREEVGALRVSAKAAAGAGELACDGSSLLRTKYPDLFAAIGTTWGAVDGTHFSLPDFITSNRFMRAAGGSVAVGTTQANQNQAHTHAFTGSLTAGTLSTDSQGSHSHTANVSDPTHVHQYNNVANGSVLSGGGSFATGTNSVSNTGAASTGIGVSVVANGAHTHNVTGAPSIGTLANASQGGTEARPENAAVLVCIKY